jgi:hypothetical protein
LDLTGLFGNLSSNDSFADSCNTSVCSELTNSNSRSAQSSPYDEGEYGLNNVTFPQLIPASIGAQFNQPKPTTTEASMTECLRLPSSPIYGGKGNRYQHEDGYYHPSMFLNNPLHK